MAGSPLRSELRSPRAMRTPRLGGGGRRGGREEKKKNQIRSRSGRAGRQRGPGGAGVARGAALRGGGAAAAPAVRVCVCLCFTPCRCRSSSGGNRAVSSREEDPLTSPAPPSSLLVASADILPFGGVVLRALRRQEGKESGPLGFAEDFFLLQNALKGAEVLAYIQLHTSVNLSLCGAPKPRESNPPKSQSRWSRGQEKATPGASPFKKKKIVINPSCREKANTMGTNQIASLPTGPVALSPP